VTSSARRLAKAIDEGDLAVSPIVILELHFLREIGTGPRPASHRASTV